MPCSLIRVLTQKWSEYLKISNTFLAQNRLHLMGCLFFQGTKISRVHIFPKLLPHWLDTRTWCNTPCGVHAQCDAHNVMHTTQHAPHTCMCTMWPAPCDACAQCNMHHVMDVHNAMHAQCDAHTTGCTHIVTLYVTLYQNSDLFLHTWFPGPGFVPPCSIFIVKPLCYFLSHSCS